VQEETVGFWIASFTHLLQHGHTARHVLVFREREVVDIQSAHSFTRINF
jgi:hypothetical protein